MAPERRPVKKAEGKIASAIKKPAPKKPTEVGKKSIGVAKKPPPKKPVGKTSAAIKKETKKSSTKATSKADNPIKEEHEKISDKPAGNTRAAKKNKSEEAPITTVGKSVTATSKKPRGRPTKPPGQTRAATKEPTPEPVDIPSEDTPASSTKRKRETQDKWTETTHLPVPKSPKLGDRSTRRRYKALKESESEGWDAKGFSIEEHGLVCCIDEVHSCRLPSPFADSGDQSACFLHFVDVHTTDELRNLYHLLHDNAAECRASIVENFPGDGAGGRFCLLKKKAPHVKAGGKLGDEGENTEEKELEYHDYPENAREHRFKVTKDSEGGDIQLDVRCWKNRRTGEVGYFVVNNVLRTIFINDCVVGCRLAAGPLPDFAIIEMNDRAIFWFRNRAALDYVPEAASTAAEDKEDARNGTSFQTTSKKGKDTTKDSTPPLAGGEGKSTAEEPNTHATGAKHKENDTTESQTPPLTWEDIMNDGLRRHREKRDTINGNTPRQIKNYQGMVFEQVLPAVAAIREALRDQGMTYAFAGDEVLDSGYSHVVVESSGVVGGKENTFIMPLFFRPEDKHLDKNYENRQKKRKKQQEAKTESEKQKADDIPVSEPLGHILLAVAKNGSPKAKSIQIEIRDSRQGTVDLGDIHERAREVAAIWSGMNVDPVFVDVKVVQQPHRSNACGLLTILNAWAVMLDIPLRADDQRLIKPKRNDREFLRLALEIVNLALAGFMDSRTIQAFLNVYGYSEDQGVDFQPNHIIEAVKMDPTRLRQLLHEQESKDAVENLHGPSSSQDSAHSSGSAYLKTAVFESTVQHFMDQAPEATLELAESYVADANGDLDQALTAFGIQLSQTDGPAGSKAD